MMHQQRRTAIALWTGSRKIIERGVLNQFSLRKHAYSNIKKISPRKTENFEIKRLIFFIDCGYSLEPPRRAVLTSTHNLCF